MRIIAMTKRIVKQILGDKRTLALLFIAPVFVIFLLNSILSTSIDKPDLEVTNLPTGLTDSLKHEAHVKEAVSKKSAYDKLTDMKIDGLLSYDDNKLIIYVEGSQTAITNAVNKAVTKALGNYSKNIFSSSPTLSKMGVKMIESKFVFINGSENMSTFDAIAPMLMGFFIFFFVFLLAGISFLRERISGTLERLLATPIKRCEIVMGYFFGFGIFVVIQTIIIQLFMVYGLGITIKGNPYLVLLINLLLAVGSLSLGTLLSAFSRNELQLIQFFPIVIVPQILFSGLFSLRSAPLWVNLLSKIFPLTYGADALSSVVLRGSGFINIFNDLLILTLYAVLFLVLNSLALKKYRRL